MFVVVVMRGARHDHAEIFSWRPVSVCIQNFHGAPIKGGTLLRPQSGGWYCPQSGGTDVVDLPDFLLPAGQYLDMFDSESETDVPSDSSDEELVEV